MDYISVIKGSAIGAALGTLIIGFFKSYIDESVKSHFKDKENKKNQKRQLISDIKDIVLEGQTAGWEVKIKDWKHIYKIILEVSDYDDMLSSILSEYIGKWAIFSFMGDGSISTENTKFLVENKQKLIRLSNDILSQLKKL